MKNTPALASRVMSFLTVLVLAGCATTSLPLLHEPFGVPVTRGDFADSTATELQVTKAVRLLELASPASLAEAARILASPDVLGESRVTGAVRLGAEIWRLLYPEAESPFPAGAAAEGGRTADPSRFLALIRPGLTLLDPEAAVAAETAQSLAASLSEAADLNPESPLAPHLQGLLALRAAGLASDARAFFEEALRRAPGFHPAARQCAALIISGGTAAGEWDLFQRLVSLLPTAAERFSTTARGALAAGKAEAAADAAAQALLAAPGEAGFALLRAEALEAQGNWYKALWIADAVLKVKPGVTEAIVMKARLLFEKGENGAEALRLLDGAGEGTPLDAAIAHLRGRILLAQGRTAEGMAELMRALDLSPDRPETLSALLAAAAGMGDWESASVWFERMPREKRTADDLRLAWRAAMAMDDLEQALTCARALRAKGGGAEAMGMEAFSLLASGQPEEALAVVDEALPLAETPSLRSSLYLIRASAGSDDPQQDLRKALREEPDNREALAAIVDLLTEAGEYTKALEYARHALSLSPDDAELARKVSDLEQSPASEE
jgi:tetratricopeptide (TPR) repeat protein